MDLTQPALLVQIATFLEGSWDASWLAIVGYTLVLTHITIVSVTVYLHRYSAHRSLELNGALKHFFRFWLWLTTGIRTIEWTSIHRKHHVTCETEDDPHSPQIYGISKVLWQGAELYRAGVNEETLARYGRGTPDDWMERNVYRRFGSGGIALMAATNIVLLGPIGLTVWAVQMAWIPFFAAGVINGIGHYWGYRNFESPDAGRNITPWGVLMGGEELHNNHHTYPNSAKFSVKPWEFDLGWYWVKLFRALGLAKVLSTGPIVKRVPGRHVIDTDTVWAVVNDRFRVMAHYAEGVVAPLVEQEYRSADAATRALIKRARSLLVREETLVDEAGRAAISELVDVSPLLKTTYDLRRQLLTVWSKRGGDTEELLNAFKEWCVDAEATGINVLKHFVVELKSYTVPKLTVARS